MSAGFGAIFAKPPQSIGYCIRIIENVPGGNTQHFDALANQPLGPRFIALWPITHVMSDAVDFNREPCGRAVEVEHVGTDRVLPAETNVGGSQPDPEKLLRQRKCAPQSPCALVGLVGGAHGLTPTPFSLRCIVPLPIAAP